MEQRTYGYARVSSKDQNLERQIQALIDYGVERDKIIEDKASGKDFERVGYQHLKQNLLRRGDTLVIKELDRLGRDKVLIRNEWQQLKEMGVDIEIIDMPILNTKGKSDIEKDLITDIVLCILAYIADNEREKNRQRQREGIERLKARNGGKGIGRPKIDYPKDWKQVYDIWKLGKVTAVKAMNYLGLKKNTFYRLVKQYEEENILINANSNEDK